MSLWRMAACAVRGGRSEDFESAPLKAVTQHFVDAGQQYLPRAVSFKSPLYEEVGLDAAIGEFL